MIGANGRDRHDDGGGGGNSRSPPNRNVVDAAAQNASRYDASVNKTARPSDGTSTNAIGFVNMSGSTDRLRESNARKLTDKRDEAAKVDPVQRHSNESAANRSKHGDGLAEQVASGQN